MTTSLQNQKRRSLLQNMVSMVGIAVCLLALFPTLFFIGMDLFGGGTTSPYAGIVAYMVLPTILIFGIMVAVVGAVLERRRRRFAAPGEVPPFPVLDLNLAETRRALFWTVVALGTFLLLSAVGSYRAYHFTDSVTFCGRVCHQVMKPEFTAYRNSPHARVRCVECHIGPGASWFVRSKFSGMYQVYATLFNKYPRPIPVPVKNLRPAQETCEQCHWPKQFYGAVEKQNHHFLPDETNTPWIIRLLIKVGGGDPTFGPVGGIHWHMSIENKIEYIATDKERQNIAWIRKTDENGTLTVYESAEEPLEKAPESYEIRRMDCIDCHDRPTHIYRSPSTAVNLALQTNRIDRDLPSVKEKSVGILAKEYTSDQEALISIADELKAYYKGTHPELYKKEQPAIEAAVDELENIYQNNFFPHMKSRWNVYPDNIGHLMWKGCFRCHDEKHKSKAGQTISKDCSSCHMIISQGSGKETATSLEGLEFKHPVDIGDAWKETNCNECHTGVAP